MERNLQLFIEMRMSASPQAGRWVSAIVSMEDVVNDIIAVGRARKRIVQTISEETIQKLGKDLAVELIEDLRKKNVVVVAHIRSREGFELIEEYLLSCHRDPESIPQNDGRLFVCLQMMREEARALPLQLSADYVYEM